MTRDDYGAGKRAKAIEALEKALTDHKNRLNHHSDRLGRIERILYIGFGVVIALEALPRISSALKVIAG